MADISAIKLPSGTTYNIKDINALPLTGGSVTGPVSFGDSVSMDEATIGDLVVNGSASFTNNIQANTINGVAIGSSPKFTDTVTTATTTGSGNAVTSITASNGVLTVTKGTTFLTSHQDISGKADKATTLAGYGITDAKIASGTITLGSNTITPLTSSSTLSAAKLSGAIPSAVTATTQASTDNSTKIATTAYVTTAIANLPEPMIFKGSVGTGGTITSLPTAAASNEGWTYKVITALSSPAAKVGDTVISNGSSWIVIPSGDEPSGTVTSVGVSNATNGGLTVSGSPITSSGTVTIGHSNVLTSARTTQAVYPIKIDINGHISAYGSAVTISTNWLNGSATGSVRTINSAAEDSNYTIGSYAVTEGSGTKASGQGAHAEGGGTTASGDWSHTEGGGTTASGGNSHAEGGGTTAYGSKAHAEGCSTNANGQSSHAEGNHTTANGESSHAEGNYTTANGNYSHAEGNYTTAKHRSQHTFGEYNILDSSTATATNRGNYVEIVGNGTSASALSNARTLDWSGNEVLAGKLTVGAVGTNSMDVATVGQIPTVPSSTGSATTGISIAAHGTGTVIGVQSTTTTASKVTVGSSSTDYGVKSAGSASTWTFEEKTIPNVTSAGTASSWTFEEKTIPNVTAAGSGSASLTFAMDTTDTKKLKITFSHTHTAPTIGTAIKVQSKSGGSNGTAPTLGTAIKVQSKSGGANSTAPTLGSKVPTVSASDVTVPIKNTSASTFVTGTTHTVTDNGHTHTI